MRFNPDASELSETLNLLKEKHIIIGYHGTTTKQAQKILVEGFKRPDVRDILKQAYEVAGLNWQTRKKFPTWARRYMASEIKSRIFERYNHMSFGSHGVASRFSGKGGEVLHETVHNINAMKAFWQSDFPKTEEGYEAWASTMPNFRSFYQDLGEPIVLKVYIQLNSKDADYWIRYIENLFKWEKEDKFDAWISWNYTYHEIAVRDPENILKIEIADPPKIEP